MKRRGLSGTSEVKETLSYAACRWLSCVRSSSGSRSSNVSWRNEPSSSGRSTGSKSSSGSILPYTAWMTAALPPAASTASRTARSPASATRSVLLRTTMSATARWRSISGCRSRVAGNSAASTTSTSPPYRMCGLSLASSIRTSSWGSARPLASMTITSSRAAGPVSVSR